MPTLLAPTNGVLAKTRVEALNQALAQAIHGNPHTRVSNGQLSKFLGISPSTASRLRSGEQGAGHSTLLKVKRKLPDVPLSDLFESTKDLEAEIRSI